MTKVMRGRFARELAIHYISPHLKILFLGNKMKVGLSESLVVLPVVRVECFVRRVAVVVSVIVCFFELSSMRTVWLIFVERSSLVAL